MSNHNQTGTHVLQFTDTTKPSITIRPFTTDGASNDTVPSPVSALLHSSATTASTSLLLVGKGVPEYGDIISNDLIYLMEHFANPKEPLRSIEGQVWYKSGADVTLTADPQTTPALYVRNDTADDSNPDNYGDRWDSILLATGTTPLTSSWDVGNQRITNLAIPTDVSDAVRKDYVDSHINNAAAHLTTEQNNLLDNLESLYTDLSDVSNSITKLSAADIGQLLDLRYDNAVPDGGVVDGAGLTSGSVQEQLDLKLSLAGTQTVTGNKTFSGTVTFDATSSLVADAASNLSWAADPTTDDELTRRLYVTTNFVSKNVDSVVTSEILLDDGVGGFASPVEPRSAISEGYGDATYVSFAGTGTQTISHHTKYTSAIFVDNDDLVNKGYVDSVAGGASAGAVPLAGNPGNAMTGHLELFTGTSPSLASHAIGLGFADGRYLRLSGGSMTGSLTLSGSPTNTLHAATKGYVDTGFLAITGGTLTGTLTLSGAPTPGTNEAATSSYVDNADGLLRTDIDNSVETVTFNALTFNLTTTDIDGTVNNVDLTHSHPATQVSYVPSTTNPATNVQDAIDNVEIAAAINSSSKKTYSVLGDGVTSSYTDIPAYTPGIGELQIYVDGILQFASTPAYQIIEYSPGFTTQSTATGLVSTQAIIAASAGAGGTFTVAGNQTGIFVTGYDFDVENSSGNNNTYQVASSVFDSTNTIITVNETVPSAVGDGDIVVGAYDVYDSEVNNDGTIYRLAANGKQLIDIQTTVASMSDGTINEIVSYPTTTSLTIRGDWSTYWQTSDTITITGSTAAANDGTWTIVSSVYSAGTNRTTITVSGVVFDQLASGAAYAENSAKDDSFSIEAWNRRLRVRRRYSGGTISVVSGNDTLFQAIVNFSSFATGVASVTLAYDEVDTGVNTWLDTDTDRLFSSEVTFSEAIPNNSRVMFIALDKEV